MNYSEALSYTFRDEDWLKKIAIGGLIAWVSFYLGLVFIFGFLLLGYYLGIVRNVLKGEERVLPAWADWGKLFVDGIMGSIILFVYLVLTGGLCALIIINICAGVYVSDVEMTLGIVLVSLLTCFSLMFLTNFGLLQFAATNNFAAAFSLSTLSTVLKEHFGDFLAIIIFSMILNAILLFAGLGILSPFTNFWGMVVQAHLFGQCAKRCLVTTEVAPSA